MRGLDYDLEIDEIDDVLNGNHIAGLSHAGLDGGKVVIYVLSDTWSKESEELCKEVCSEFGYHGDDVVVEGSKD